jgi:hypothetical protein
MAGIFTKEDLIENDLLRDEDFWSKAEAENVVFQDDEARAKFKGRPTKTPKRPGRLAKRAFEALPMRPAAMIQGEVVRGRRGEIHAQMLERVARTRNIGYEELIDKIYDPITDKPLPGSEPGFSLGREGKFLNREQMETIVGGPGESGQQRDRTRAKFRRDPMEFKSQLRAESQDPVEQYRRRQRGKKTALGLRQIKDEIKTLSKTEKTPEVLSRIQQLTRRKGLLKNLAKKAGVFSFVTTPFTTGEALSGLNSSDKNEQLRSIETMLGLPEFSTGRSLSEKEKNQKQIWFDPITGEGKI